jgi:precorrin-2 dehydrogenase / sirohydrochlorin ferrochelatase
VSAVTETESKEFPVCLRLEGRHVLVVGGGVIAEGKIRGLVAAGAVIRVIAPEVTAPIAALAATGTVNWVSRAFQPSDVEGYRIIFSATNELSATRAVAVEARRVDAWLNAADDPQFCDFTLPSVGRRGLVTVAVSTGGAAPAMAARIRRRLMAELSLNELGRTRLSAVVRKHFERTPLRSMLLRWVANARPLQALEIAVTRWSSTPPGQNGVAPISPVAESKGTP